MTNKTTPLHPERVYHIYNHAHGDENLFRSADNYHYFLQKYSEYIYPIAKTYAYCLMPNHFHLMVSIREEQELIKVFTRFKKDSQTGLTGFENLSGLLSKQFSNFFNAYTKAFNKQQDRKGSLFIRPFKRKLIHSDAYFTQLVAYIHNNPLHHGFVADIQDWPHSSWHSYLIDKPTKIARNEGLSWFGNRSEFISIHRLLSKKDVNDLFEEI